MSDDKDTGPVGSAETITVVTDRDRDALNCEHGRAGICPHCLHIGAQASPTPADDPGPTLLKGATAGWKPAPEYQVQVDAAIAAGEKVPAPGIRHFGKRSDGVWGCDTCCTGDRCDDPTHFSRRNCPVCAASGAIPEEFLVESTLPAAPETTDREHDPAEARKMATDWLEFDPKGGDGENDYERAKGNLARWALHCAGVREWLEGDVLASRMERDDYARAQDALSTELAEARGEVERIEAMGRNLCRICGIDYEAAFLLADKPTALTEEEIASAVKFFAEGPTGKPHSDESETHRCLLNTDMECDRCGNPLHHPVHTRRESTAGPTGEKSELPPEEDGR